MRAPSSNPITLKFGATTDPYTPSSPHKGTDFSYQPDSTIYAPFSGVVQLVPNNGNDGNGVYMTSGNQFHGMLHTSKYLVPNGASVTEGQPIAIMGDTGYAFGVHLHWCVKLNGVFIDPMSLVTEKGEDMNVSREEVIEMYKLAVPGQGVNDDFVKVYTGKPLDDVIHALRDDPSINGYRDKLLAAGQPIDVTINGTKFVPSK